MRAAGSVAAAPGRSMSATIPPSLPEFTGTAARVTPSDARGLGRAALFAKGWVLVMLAATERLRVAAVPLRRVGPPLLGYASAVSGPLLAFLYGHLCPAKKTAPEGEDAGIGPAEPLGSERDEIMANKTSTPKTATQPATRREPVRQAITLELVQAHAPHASLAENLSRTFGLDPVDYAAVRDATEEHVARSAQALQPTLNDKAMEIHLQRVVGSFVSSAFGAAQFYGTKVTQAKDLTMKSQNDDRDEDRGGVSGFESRADRAREFAANMGLQACALMAAAEGAVAAYAHITGDNWKPYEAPAPAASSTNRQSAAAQMAAFGA